VVLRADRHRDRRYGSYLPRGDRWRVFFEGSIAGVVTVAAGLALLIARSNRFEASRALEAAPTDR
jgi:hypothetical protein